MVGSGVGLMGYASSKTALGRGGSFGIVKATLVSTDPGFLILDPGCVVLDIDS